jgi:hypothetical protein
MRLGALVSSLALTFGLSVPALAQDLVDLPPPQGDPSVFGGLDQTRPFWESGKPRAFVGAVFDVGVVFARPTLQMGYGKPHLTWVGVEGYSSVSTGGVAMYGGARGAVSIFDLRGGARYNVTVNQSFLEPRESYSVDQSHYETGPSSRYVAIEGEGALNFPLPGGGGFLVGTAVYTTGVPDGFFHWEDSFNVIVDPPWLWRGRVGYRADIGRFDTMKLGGALDVIGIPGRDAFVTRAGPVLSVSLTHHLEAIGAALLVISSPDELGLRGADFGQIGLRYKWATGDRWPEFP